MWKVVYIAQTKENAQEIKELLTNNGFLIQMNVSGAKKGGQKSASLTPKQKMLMRCFARTVFARKPEEYYEKNQNYLHYGPKHGRRCFTGRNDAFRHGPGTF